MNKFVIGDLVCHKSFKAIKGKIGQDQSNIVTWTVIGHGEMKYEDGSEMIYWLSRGTETGVIRGFMSEEELISFN